MRQFTASRNVQGWCGMPWLWPSGLGGQWWGWLSFLRKRSTLLHLSSSLPHDALLKPHLCNCCKRFYPIMFNSVLFLKKAKKLTFISHKTLKRTVLSWNFQALFSIFSDQMISLSFLQVIWLFLFVGCKKRSHLKTSHVHLCNFLVLENLFMNSSGFD